MPERYKNIRFGSLYPPAMMISGVVCYNYLPEDIRQKFRYEDMMASKSILDPTKTFGEALEKSGFKGDKKYRLSPDRYKYMFETHIEQGPILEDNGNDIGVVDCVLGMFNYRLKFYGQTTHAGTFPMPKRLGTVIPCIGIKSLSDMLRKRARKPELNISTFIRERGMTHSLRHICCRQQ